MKLKLERTYDVKLSQGETGIFVTINGIEVIGIFPGEIEIHEDEMIKLGFEPNF